MIWKRLKDFDRKRTFNDAMLCVFHVGRDKERLKFNYGSAVEDGRKAPASKSVNN